MTPMNPEPGTPAPVPSVWPPPPTSFEAPTAQASPLAALAGFRVQSVWLVLLLTLITLGIYAVFWLRRQSALVNSLRPDLNLSVAYANVVLVVAFLGAGLDVASWINDASSLDNAASLGDRLFGIMALVLSLQVRGGFNRLLGLEKTSPYWFGAVWTWLFGVVYLQYKINQDVRRWQNEPRAALGY